MHYTDNRELRGALQRWITPELAADVVTALADTPAASQIPAWTRAPIVERFLDQWGALKQAPVEWFPNHKRTGNGVLSIGRRSRKTVWLIAHWDNISFLIGPEISDGYALTPFYHHLMLSGSQPGMVLRYVTETDSYEVVCRGTIVGGEKPTFRPEDHTALRPGWRVVYDTPSEHLGDGIYSGQMDNAAGSAAVLLATGFLSQFDDIEVLSCFTDEEEGPVASGNTAFARGSRRLIDLFEAPDVAVVSDIHSVSEVDAGLLGQGALFREYASQTRGGVTPPWLYEHLRSLSLSARPETIVNENLVGGVSRSDCTSLLQKTPNIALCGPPVVGRHYAEGVYRCSAHDIAHLGRFLVMLSLSFHGAWAVQAG